MPGTKILSAFLIMVPATILLTTEATLGEPAAEQCKASPGGPPHGECICTTASIAPPTNIAGISDLAARMYSTRRRWRLLTRLRRERQMVDADNAAPGLCRPMVPNRLRRCKPHSRNANRERANGACASCAGRSGRNRQSGSRRTGVRSALAWRTFRKRKIWSRASRRQLSDNDDLNGATRTRSRKCRRSGLAGAGHAARSAAR